MRLGGKIKFLGKDSWKVLTLKRAITGDRVGVRWSEIWNGERNQE
jgi:hypothetical protein